MQVPAGLLGTGDVLALGSLGFEVRAILVSVNDNYSCPPNVGITHLCGVTITVFHQLLYLYTSR